MLSVLPYMNELPDDWVNSMNRTTPLNKLIVDCAKTDAVSSRQIPLNLTSQTKMASLSKASSSI